MSDLFILEIHGLYQDSHIEPGLHFRPSAPNFGIRFWEIGKFLIKKLRRSLRSQFWEPEIVSFLEIVSQSWKCKHGLRDEMNKPSEGRCSQRRLHDNRSGCWSRGCRSSRWKLQGRSTGQGQIDPWGSRSGWDRRVMMMHRHLWKMEK